MINRVIEEKESALALLNHRDNKIQGIQYKNVGLLGEIRGKDHQIERCENRIQDLITNRHFPRSRDIDTVLAAVEKNCNEDCGKGGRHQYCMVRCQDRALKNQLELLRVKYPSMEVKEPKCKAANAIHFWNWFKRDILGKVNYYKNHFSLPEEHREFFEDLFDIEIE